MERDRKSKSYKYLQSDFNSHAHVERDVESAETIILQCISTHTLTWSVTTTGLKRGDNNVDFNSHAHVERDSVSSSSVSFISNFNSHAHVERDLIINRF